MPTLTVRKDIVFHYTDSGPVDHNEYSTLIFVHGLSFHTAIFQKLLPIARTHSLRVICLSRREYGESSPYTDEELKAINHGSEEEQAKFLHEQGVLVALFVDGIIQTLSLPKAGGVTIAGWSMGNIFTIALRTCIGDLHVDIQERLRSYTRCFIHLDAPVHSLGFPWEDPPETEPDVFIEIFPKMISGYYKHVNVDSKDLTQLNNVGDPSRKPTTETMTPEELASVIDFAPCFKCDIPLLLPAYKSTIFKQMKKAFVDSKVREGWGGIPAWNLCGDSNVPLIQVAPWVLEETIGSENFNFKLIRDANHFLMWEEPDRFLIVMKECIPA